MNDRSLAAAVRLRQEGQNALGEGRERGQELVGDRSISDVVAAEAGLELSVAAGFGFVSSFLATVAGAGWAGVVAAGAGVAEAGEFSAATADFTSAAESSFRFQVGAGAEEATPTSSENFANSRAMSPL